MSLIGKRWLSGSRLSRFSDFFFLGNEASFPGKRLTAMGLVGFVFCSLGLFDEFVHGFAEFRAQFDHSLLNELEGLGH